MPLSPPLSHFCTETYMIPRHAICESTFKSLNIFNIIFFRPLQKNMRQACAEADGVRGR